jgi:hypothetical protein
MAKKKKFTQKRSIVETLIGKFKNRFGATLSRFRPPHAALSAICARILALISLFNFAVRFFLFLSPVRQVHLYEECA